MDRTWNTPVEKTAKPICNALKPRTRPRNSGVRKIVAKIPMPVTNEKKQPSEKLRLVRARKSTTGWAWVRLRQIKAMPAIPEIQAVARMARTLFEGVFEAAEKDRRQRHARIVGAAQQGQVGTVDAYQHGHDQGDKDPGGQIDKEQPMPRVIVGDPPADSRSERRRQR